MGATKCSSKNPATCRYHGHAQIAIIKEQQRAAEASKDFASYYAATKALEELANTEDKENFSNKVKEGVLNSVASPMPLYPNKIPSPKLKLGSNGEWFSSSNSPAISEGSYAPDYLHTIDSWDNEAVYVKADLHTLSDLPQDIRVQANRPLTDNEIRQVSQLASGLHSEIFGAKEFDTFVDRDGQASVSLTVDNARKEYGNKEGYAEYSRRLNATIRRGSAVRKTNDDGPGTIGTRKHKGLGNDVSFTLYYRADDIKLQKG